MKVIIRFASLAVLAVTLAGGSAFAQRQGRQNNRQQQMAASVAQNAIEALSAQSDPLQLIFRKDVQLDLPLEEGVRVKFDHMREQQLSDLQVARMQSRRNQAAVTDLIATQTKQTQDKLNTLLTDAQKARLTQISLQIQGNSAILSPDIQKQLGVTVEQRGRIVEIKNQHNQTLAQLQSSASQGQIQASQIPELVLQYQKDMNTALGEVLTPAQTEELKKLFGVAFKPRQ